MIYENKKVHQRNKGHHPKVHIAGKWYNHLKTRKFQNGRMQLTLYYTPIIKFYFINN